MLGVMKTHSGFITIIGPTNAGKSTLVNQIMGRKVSAVSHKVQTTRSRFRAVKMVGDIQLILLIPPEYLSLIVVWIVLWLVQRWMLWVIRMRFY